MRELKMKNGMVTKVDDADYEALKKYKWHAVMNGNRNWYARTNLFVNGRSHPIALHRILLGVTNPSYVVDHIDGDSLNNQRRNLRKCASRENSLNKRKCKSLTRGLTSKYKGVCFKAKPRKFYASIDVQRKKIHLGVFQDETEAAKAYNVAATKYYGEFARLNEV